MLLMPSNIFIGKDHQTFLWEKVKSNLIMCEIKLSCPLSRYSFDYHFFQSPPQTMSFQKAFNKDLSKKSNLSTSPQALFFFFSSLRKSGVVMHHQYVSAHWHWHTCLWHELRCWVSGPLCTVVVRRLLQSDHLKRSQIAPQSEEGVVAKSIHFGLKGS